MIDPASTAARKFRWRILMPITLLIVLSSLDRVNISFAALQMNNAIGLSPEMYGFAVGIFFVGYLLLQFPSTALLTHIGARRWIACCVVAWGTVAMCMAFVHSATEMVVLRFLLGCAESGFAPGILYYTMQWMPERYRANTIAITMLAVPISVIIGGPLCGWLMTMHTPYEMPGWRWMFLIEGCLTVVMGVVAYLVVIDTPANAAWLSDAEKQALENERPMIKSQGDVSISATLRNILLTTRETRLWLAAAVWAATLIGANGMMFWLPLVMKDLATLRGIQLSDLKIGVLSALPWVGVALGMISNSWHSDKTGERYWHVALGLIIAALGLCMAINVNGVGALVALFIAGLGLGAAQGVFWAIPSAIINKARGAQGITLINLVGNIGSMLGPYMIGVIRARHASTSGPIVFVAMMLLLGLIFLFLLRGQHDAMA